MEFSIANSCKSSIDRLLHVPRAKEFGSNWRYWAIGQIDCSAKAWQPPGQVGRGWTIKNKEKLPYGGGKLEKCPPQGFCFPRLHSTPVLQYNRTVGRHPAPRQPTAPCPLPRGFFLWLLSFTGIVLLRPFGCRKARYGDNYVLTLQSTNHEKMGALQRSFLLQNNLGGHPFRFVVLGSEFYKQA